MSRGVGSCLMYHVTHISRIQRIRISEVTPTTDCLILQGDSILTILISMATPHILLPSSILLAALIQPEPDDDDDDWGRGDHAQMVMK